MLPLGRPNYVSVATEDWDVVGVMPTQSSKEFSECSFVMLHNLLTCLIKSQLENVARVSY